MKIHAPQRDSFHHTSLPLGLAPKAKLGLMSDMLFMIHSSVTNIFNLFICHRALQSRPGVHAYTTGSWIQFQSRTTGCRILRGVVLTSESLQVCFESIYLKWCSDYINAWIISTGRLNVSHNLIGLEKRSAIPSMVLWAAVCCKGEVLHAIVEANICINICLYIQAVLMKTQTLSGSTYSPAHV